MTPNLEYFWYHIRPLPQFLWSPPLQWRHNGHDSVSKHQPHDCLHNHLFRRRSKKTSKLHVTGLCAGNSTVTSEFPAQMASNAENVSIWWRHHVMLLFEAPHPMPMSAITGCKLANLGWNKIESQNIFPVFYFSFLSYFGYPLDTENYIQRSTQ